MAKEAGIPKGSGTGRDYAGDLSMASAVKIAKMKIDGSYAKDLRGAVKEVLGSCVSMGVKVEGKPAKEAYADIAAGNHDALSRIPNKQRNHNSCEYPL